MNTTGATSSLDYWQRKGHALHLRTQRDQPYGSMRRCCERCGVMVWPERFGEAETPEWTDDEAEFLASAYRCDRMPSNAELSGPRPLAAEGSRSNVGLGTGGQDGT